MQQLLKIRKFGVYASLQDRGREGYRKFGVPVSGPMDFLAHYWGNKILGNPTNTPSLEIFIGGFEMVALSNQTYIITGASGQFTVNDKKVEPWKTFFLKKGDLLKINAFEHGQIIYLSVRGGFLEEEILGSQSFYLPAGIGRELNVDSVLYGKQLNEQIHYRTSGLYKPFVPNIKKKIISVYKGPHFDLFTYESIERFFTTKYRFTGGNRMGYYFSGENLLLKNEQDILSEGTQFGTIQVPTSGQPIILMADSQTVGGYPVIATVSIQDLRYIAQLNMFEEIEFELLELVGE